MRHRTLLCSTLATLALFGCAKKDSPAADTTAAATGSGDAMADMPGMSTTAARDADQEFLRMMVDHHEGMAAMADTALKKGGAAVKSEATTMRAKQTAEQRQMLDMLKTQYGEDKMPMVTSDNASMISMLSGASGSTFDRTFREHVIMHHEAGIKMMDQFQSRLTKADVKQMAEKMKADQTKEIAELRRKLG